MASGSSNAIRRGTEPLFKFEPVPFALREDISRCLLPIAPFALIIGFDALVLSGAFISYPSVLLASRHFYCLPVLPTKLLGLDVFDRLSQAIGT